MVRNYAKDTSESGQHLIEMCRRNDLILIDTVFKHKKPRTTWTSNQKSTLQRKETYRNQIDYIIIMKKHISQAQDARGYSRIETFTDHKLVKASFKITLYKIKHNKLKIKLKIKRLCEKNI